MNTNISKETEAMSYQELKELLETKKQSEIEKITKELEVAEGMVTALKAQLVNLGALAPTTPVGRGQKKNNFKGSGAIRRKRGAVGESIVAFLATKGKKGAHITEIAKAIGNKPANVTAFFYAKGNRSKFKNLGQATFAIAK